MINCKYADAYAEVYNILQYLEKSEYKKIPQNFIETIEKNRNINHEFEVSANQEKMKSTMLIETKALLLNIYRDYLANPAQSQKIKQWQNEDRLALEEQKAINTKTNLFEDKKKTENKKQIDENTSLVEVKPISLWKKIIMKIKGIFIKK